MKNSWVLTGILSAYIVNGISWLFMELPASLCLIQLFGGTKHIYSRADMMGWGILYLLFGFFLLPGIIGLLSGRLMDDFFPNNKNQGKLEK